MEQEPSWLATQYIMLVNSRPTHTQTQVPERPTQVVAVWHAEKQNRQEDHWKCDVTLVTLLYFHKEQVFRGLFGHTSYHNPQRPFQSNDPFRDGCVQVHFFFRIAHYCSTCAGKTKHAGCYQIAMKPGVPAIWVLHPRKISWWLVKTLQKMKSILFYKSFNKQKYQIFSINTFSDECDLLIFSVILL